MAIKIGTQDLKEAYLGFSPLQKIYLGNTLVWEKQYTPPLVLFDNGQWSGDYSHYYDVIWGRMNAGVSYIIQDVGKDTSDDTGNKLVKTDLNKIIFTNSAFDHKYYIGNCEITPINLSNYTTLKITVTSLTNTTFQDRTFYSLVSFNDLSLHAYDYTYYNNSTDNSMVSGIQLVEGENTIDVTGYTGEYAIRIVSPSLQIAKIELEGATTLYTWRKYGTTKSYILQQIGDTEYITYNNAISAYQNYIINQETGRIDFSTPIVLDQLREQGYLRWSDQTQNQMRRYICQETGITYKYAYTSWQSQAHYTKVDEADYGIVASFNMHAYPDDGPQLNPSTGVVYWYVKQ